MAAAELNSVHRYAAGGLLALALSQAQIQQHSFAGFGFPPIISPEDGHSTSAALSRDDVVPWSSEQSGLLRHIFRLPSCTLCDSWLFLWEQVRRVFVTNEPYEKVKRVVAQVFGHWRKGLGWPRVHIGLTWCQAPHWSGTPSNWTKEQTTTCFLNHLHFFHCFLSLSISLRCWEFTEVEGGRSLSPCLVAIAHLK